MHTSRLTILALLLTTVLSSAQAALQQASSLPARAQVSAAQNNTLSISWRITTDVTHVDGALSAGGVFVNALTGTSLGVGNPTTIGTPTGTGPLTFSEIVTVSAQQVAQWRSQGVKQVGYRRTFTAVASTPRTAQLIISLQASGLAAARENIGGELRVIRMDMEFADGKRIDVVERNASLVAQVALSYSGSGTLRGRWEVAEPGSQSQPFFRTLQLIRQNLAAGQRTILISPNLPTQASGRYVVRFCIDGNEVTTETCADTDTAVQTIYDVLNNKAVALLHGVYPSNQTINDLSVFHWPAVAAATTYQLQVFRPAVAPQTDPTFVTGMLLPGGVVEATLSELVRSKLERGQRYLWRITAHDSEGGLLARSEAAVFVYRPGQE